MNRRDLAKSRVDFLPCLTSRPKGNVPNQGKPDGPSVLIVEDDARTRLALVILLRELGYRSMPVATVAEGVERLDGQDLAILDINLPDGLGLHVLRRIRDENRPIRVAVATATDDWSVLEEARRLDVEMILRKPIDVNVLIAWLETGG